MKKSYFIYAPLALSTFVIAIIIAGGSLLLFIDIPSVLFILIPPIYILLAIFGPKGIIEAFKFAFEKSEATKSDLEKGIIFFTTALKIFLLDGVLATFTGFILILTYLSKAENSEVGIYISVALLTLYYSLLIILIVIIPFKAALEKRVVEFK